MRREPYGVGSFVHVVKRGARGLPFLKCDADRERSLLMLAHFNDSQSRPFWLRDLSFDTRDTPFVRPSTWEELEPLVRIHAFCLHENHFHLLLEEIIEGGISRFMQKIGNGLAGYINERYGELGSPFQGSYKSKTIDSDSYLRYVFGYIQVKNVFEQFPGGYCVAEKSFEEAYQWALGFRSASLIDHLGMGRSDLPKKGRGIVERGLFADIWNGNSFRDYAHDVIEGRAHIGTDPKSFSGAFV